MLTLLMDCDQPAALRGALYSLRDAHVRLWLTTSHDSRCRQCLAQRGADDDTRCFEYPTGYPLIERWRAPIDQLADRYALVLAQPSYLFPHAIATVAGVDLGPGFIYQLRQQSDSGHAPPTADVRGDELALAPLWVAPTTLRRAWNTDTPWVTLREITALIASHDVLAGVL